MVSNGNRISEHLPTTESVSPMLSDLSETAEQWLKSARSFVTERPVACLVGAFATGVVIAWFLKRTR